MPTHYEVLGVAYTSTLEEIKKAYKKIAIANHPDKTYHLPFSEREEREKTFKLANNAYETLNDETKRLEYNRKLGGGKQATSSRASKTSEAQAPPPPPSTWTYRDPAAEAKTTEEQKARWEDIEEDDNKPMPQGHNPFNTYRSQPDPYEQGPRSSWYYGSTFTGNSTRAQHRPPIDSYSIHSQSTHNIRATADGTTIEYQELHSGWAFSLTTSLKFTLHGVPIFEPLKDQSHLPHSDQRCGVQITMQLSRADCSDKVNLPTEDILLSINQTLDRDDPSYSSLWEEDGSGICLRVTVLTAKPLTNILNLPMSTTPFTMFGWAASLGYLAPNLSTYRVTHISFWDYYPSHVFRPGMFGATVRGYSPDSPIAELIMMNMKVEFVDLWDGKAMICDQIVWRGKRMWRVLVVGYLFEEDKM
jgi:curved DNA-binding protein CbpA